MTPETYDYVVIGAGSSGCVVAGRLAERGTTLLLEAGPEVRSDPDLGPKVDTPARLMQTWWSGITKIYPTEPQAHLGDRTIGIHRGRVVGGSHAINGMIYVRGSRHDYDTWAQLGSDGWSYAEVLPYFQRSEHFDGRPLAYAAEDLLHHGTGGPLAVRPLPNPSALATAFIEAASAMGYPHSRPSWDFNGFWQDDAAGLYQVTVAGDGRRASTASAFLGVAARPPSVAPDCVATRILFEGRRAIGVECLREGRVARYRAEREVILAAGAFESPKLLMLSGIGPAEHLRAAGIEPRVDLPGVGENLQDHLQILLYHPAGSGPDPGPAGFTAEAGLFCHTRDRSWAASADLQYHVLGRLPEFPPAVAQAFALPARYFLICPVLCKPQSRGHVRLRVSEPAADPVVQPNYLECASDLDVLIAGIDQARAFADTAALRPFHAGTGAFAVAERGGRLEHVSVPAGDRSALRAFVAATAATVWHPVGTCKMGRDRLAVVDPELRVYGVDRLRVADASVIPIIPSGNVNATCIMIGEKCAALV